MVTNKQPSVPLILGVPGGGLRRGQVHGSVGAVTAGAAGEERTAAVLNRLAEQWGCTVLHDFMLPSAKYQANVDHAIVSGNSVVLIDTKVWAPGFYWGLSNCYRGLEKFPPADKRTMSMAVTMLGGYLRSAGAVVNRTPIIAIWPSNDSRQLRTWAWRSPQGYKPVHGDRLEKHLKAMGLRRPAAPAIVDALSRLLVTPSAGPRRPARQNDVIIDVDDWG
jgi:hypothetical protein